MRRTFSASSRLINEIFTQYQSTFLAFCELLNNAIQADAKNITIDINYAGQNELSPSPIKKIVVIDDGFGVHSNDIDRKLLNIGDSHKKGGKGIGRFAALQIGSKATIETVGFDEQSKTFSKVIIPLTEELFRHAAKINELEIDTTESLLKGRHKTYYKITIDGIYEGQQGPKHQKHRISEKLLKDNILNSIFERYPVPIFKKQVKFIVNKHAINPEDFVINKPENIAYTFTDKKGHEHKVLCTYFNLRSSFDKIKVFLTTKNAGIDTIVGGFEYDAEWLSPTMGSWFVYIYTDTISPDSYRNFDLGNLDEAGTVFKSFVKETLNTFFKEKSKAFNNFSQKLKNDDFYPYREKEKITSKAKVVLFDKLAYLVEEKYNLINNNNKLRELIYPLIDRTITTGELDNILKQVLRLEGKYVKKFNELLERSELEDIIEFSEKVAQKLQRLNFLEKITYGEVSKHVQERKDLHKMLEHMLWVFGEVYNENTKLLSDTNLENNLTELRNTLLAYKPSKSDENINELSDKKLRSITDLFLFSERIIDAKKREVLVVELKAPKVRLSPKELEQVMNYANEIQMKDFFSSDVHFHIILIGSSLSDKAKFILKGQQKGKDDPYYYFENETGNIRISVIKWSDLIETNKRRLKYMAHILNTKDISVQEMLTEDFEQIEFRKVKSYLRTVTVKE